MPLLDHFRPPLHGPHPWEGFHHAWATLIAQQLNLSVLPRDYFAAPEITMGPAVQIDVATLRRTDTPGAAGAEFPQAWVPPKPKFTASVDFSRLEGIEVRVFQDLGGSELRAVIELVSAANKDHTATRETFAVKCAGYLRHGIGLVIIDVVTTRLANLHAAIFEMLEVKSRRSSWESRTGLYAVAYRPVTVLKKPRIEVWPVPLALGEALPVLPLWLHVDLYVPLRLEDSYLTTCRSLRIPA